MEDGAAATDRVSVTVAARGQGSPPTTRGNPRRSETSEVTVSPAKTGAAGTCESETPLDGTDGVDTVSDCTDGTDSAVALEASGIGPAAARPAETADRVRAIVDAGGQGSPPATRGNPRRRDTSEAIVSPAASIEAAAEAGAVAAGAVAEGAGTEGADVSDAAGEE